MFWKTAGLKKLNQNDSAANLLQVAAPQKWDALLGKCTEADVLADTQKCLDDDGEPSYACQATQIPAATKPLPWWEWRQYVEDYTSGNVGLGRISKSFLYMAYHQGLVNLGIGLGPLLRWMYDGFQSFLGGLPYPRHSGKLTPGMRTPIANLDLQPGEWVRVKSLEEILAACDGLNLNRGTRWDAELVPYCGGTYQVLKRVNKILNEKTGKLQELKTPCVILDSVVCQARYSECRLFCPRSIYPFWREIWLERIASRASDAGEIKLAQPLPSPSP